MESDESPQRIPKSQFKITGYGIFISLAMVMVQKRELFAEGDLICLVSTGSGLSIASALIKV